MGKATNEHNLAVCDRCRNMSTCLLRGLAFMVSSAALAPPPGILVPPEPTLLPLPLQNNAFTLERPSPSCRCEEELPKLPEQLRVLYALNERQSQAVLHLQDRLNRMLQNPAADAMLIGTPRHAKHAETRDEADADWQRTQH